MYDRVEKSDELFHHSLKPSKVLALKEPSVPNCFMHLKQAFFAPIISPSTKWPNSASLTRWRRSSPLASPRGPSPASSCTETPRTACVSPAQPTAPPSNGRDTSKPDTKVFLKSCRAGSVSASLDKVLHIFSKEASFYNVLAPKLQSFQEERGVEDSLQLKHLLPKCIAVGKVGDDAYLCLEDIMVQGYKVTGMEDFHSLDQVKLALKHVAHLHATSSAMKMKPADFPFLKDYFAAKDGPLADFFTPSLWKELQLLSFVFQAKANGIKGLEGLNIPADVTGELLDLLKSFCDPLQTIFDRTRNAFVGELGVLNHGDFHMWNMGFKGQDQIKFFDFQIVNWGSPLSDIHHYLCQVTSPEMRDAHLDEMLEHYLDCFKGFYRKLGEEPPSVFNMTELKREYLARSPLVVIFFFPWLMERFAPNKEAKKQVLDEGLSDSERVQALLKCGPNIMHMVQMYFDNVHHYNQLGTFEVMRTLLL